MGEEAAWGKESILGYQIFSNYDSTKSKDLHNLVSNLIVQETFSQVIYWILVCVVILFVGLIVSQRLTVRDCLQWFRAKQLSQQFVIIGIFFLLFGSVDTVQDFFSLPYLPGQWSLEESSELFGAIALLMATIVKFFNLPLVKYSEIDYRIHRKQKMSK